MTIETCIDVSELANHWNMSCEQDRPLDGQQIDDCCSSLLILAGELLSSDKRIRIQVSALGKGTLDVQRLRPVARDNAGFQRQ